MLTNPARSLGRARETWQKQGHSAKWIEQAAHDHDHQSDFRKTAWEHDGAGERGATPGGQLENPCFA
jgi:hypothetical protein